MSADPASDSATKPYAGQGPIGRLVDSPAPGGANSQTSDSGWRVHLGELFDRLVLGLAIAAPSESGEVFDPEYADAMVLVFDEYFRLYSLRRSAGSNSDQPADRDSR
jgi:hypothetical protein